MVTPKRIRDQGRLPPLSLEVHPANKKGRSHHTKAQKYNSCGFLDSIYICAYNPETNESQQW